MRSPTTQEKQYGSGQEDLFSPWFEGVQRGLEAPNSRAGDSLSDRYEELVDLATDPTPITDERKTQIQRRLTYLATNEGYVKLYIAHAAYLYDTPNLYDQYRSILGEIAAIYDCSLNATEGAKGYDR